MGQIACSRHDYSFLGHVCPHIRRAVLDKTPLPPIRTIEVNVLEGEVLSLLFCTTCTHGHQIEALERLSGDDWETMERAKLLPETQPVCGRCLDERLKQDP
jgi:hypothetical protein